MDRLESHAARALLFASAATLAGCSGVRSGVAKTWAITKESGGTVLWDTLLWTVGAGVLGLLAAIVGYRLLARAGAFRLEGPWGQAGRILTGILVPQLIALCLAGAGFFEGLYRGTRRALLENVETTSTYATIGALGSEAVGGLYFFDAEWRAQGSFTAARGAFLDRLREFRDGRLEIDAREARDRLRGLSEESVTAALDGVRDEAKRRFPAVASGTTGALFDLMFSWIGPALRSEPEEESGWRIPFLPRNPLAGLPDRLPEVARRSGDRNSISYHELASFVVEEALVGPSLGTVKVFCRTHSGLALLPVPFLIVIPLAGFALARKLRGAPAPPAPPTTG